MFRPYTCPGGEERTGPCPITDSDRNVLFENRMLGLPRIRQLRVMNDSCQIHPHFQVPRDKNCNLGPNMSNTLPFREPSRAATANTARRWRIGGHSARPGSG